MPRPSFLDHDPHPLAFGTSGLRGLVKDITDLEAYVNVKGALRHLVGGGPPGASVVLAGDLRPSTERIARACARAITDAGFALEHAGLVPTPAVVLHGIATRRAAVMVSGSHIPFDRNGIKISKPAGEVLKSDEPGIAREVLRVREEEYGRSAASSAFDAAGMLKVEAALPAVDPSTEERYAARYVDAFGPCALAGARVLLYEHSAVGRTLVARILRALGADVVAAGRADTFVPIDTENVGEELRATLDALVAGEGSLRLDAVVSTDGDSDRPLVAAVVDGGARARFLPGDLLGLVVAEHLGADAVAVPVSANDAVERRLRERGVPLEKTKIGSPYVVAAIDALARSGRHARVVGWEANGGFLVGSDLALAEGRVLGALPTRDAVLPIVVNLLAARAANVDLSSSWDRLPRRFGQAGLLDEFPVEASRRMMAALVPAGSAPEIDAASDPVHFEAMRGALARVFTPARGFGAITRVDVRDGVRVSFEGGDVAHVRPSGNAPQLRVYANADTQARADAIVAMALAEPDGLLRAMERALGGA